MTDTIVIEGTEFPVKGEKNGRTFTRATVPMSSGHMTGPMEWFHDKYKGPFTPVTYEGRDPIPTCFCNERVKTKRGSKNLGGIFDDIVNVDAAVVDSQGALIVGPVARGDAWVISSALNRQPYGIFDGIALGMSPSHGMAKHASADGCSFWCVQVPAVGYSDGVAKDCHSYVAPFFTRYDLPGTVNSPMSALRFATIHSANRIIKLIKDEFLGNERVKDCVTKRLVTWERSVADTKIVSGKRPCSLEDWEAMRPVLIKFTYVVAP